MLYYIVLIAEVLGAAIRKNEKIQGVKILNSELKIVQYADDTEIFATTDESINEINFLHYRQVWERDWCKN